MNPIFYRSVTVIVVFLLLIVSLIPLTAHGAPAFARTEETTVPLRVTTGNQEGYTIKVLALRTDSGLFVDIESFSRALRLSFRQENGVILMEETDAVPGSSCQLRSDNNFALFVPKDARRMKRVVQLQSAPVLRDGKLYLPVLHACRLFTLWLDKDVVYDYSSGIMTAWFWGTRLGDSVSYVGSVRPGELRAAIEGGKIISEEPGTIIKGVNVENKANGVVIMFSASGKAVRAELKKPDESGRAYFTLRNASCNVDALTKLFSGGLVKSVTPVASDGESLQFAIDLDAEGYRIKTVEFQRDEKNNQYLVYVMSDADVKGIRQKEKELQIARVLNSDVEKWRLNTIVLDAGHGGHDPGAIGVKGTREKDIVLNIVRDLGGLISKKWPDVRVVYTRKDDRFIPLHERGKIANRSGGKLFVSVHCNANNKRHIKGSEVYILGPHKSKAALEVAMFENSVITKEEDYRERYKGFSAEYLIMSSMAQSAFAKQSADLAVEVQNRIGRPNSTNGRGVRQAGFMVLWTPSMPSILVEAGYLSNSEEERVLRDRQEQTKIAYRIFQGVESYRKSYEREQLAAMGK
ncbi:MAG: N-acetylmuramoyl-L-alanine amidase [Chlorobium sp.]|jgi:N-acetylmuramoyl-L-alanine amidase|uniref:N-acetylmuramoyl-L-alanine amidase family protein n=1 Tax=Chlorobium sp. TaxID=1095 RepID=UPI001DA128F6|nr:N-acetylmuramoyl-L-alanine amidase [Chlorobium sp.]MBN1278514.1 N-acetylmuramoyl-L-alanine amidase [Chlorobiaceae bacterium]MCF8215580.1 N-acetylmuramoyl-L-alanine amidase [Chlorobium sp.]MCF8270366.1 N-acetylmuramoyl-L-alanine amidase [Chlorobium sp.]MCF8286735.1 N-acetylmuramoyl-L-alanine amidase [Chlorobium sp.]MCF8290257.1 N-acetylmuramoyl-L-alanine amidase [Chlorobium sp.]